MGSHNQIVLLRGINLGASNRVPMGALRGALNAAGFGGAEGVRTYVQSGNLAVRSDLGGDALARAIETLVSERFGVGAAAVARSAEQLQQLVDGNPFPGPAAESPKQYQVSFLSEQLGAAGLAQIAGRAATGETVAASGSGLEVYAWHPGGIHVSRLAAQLSERKLGVRTATARNWTTVLACLQLLEA